MTELCLLQKQGLGFRQSRRQQPEILNKRARGLLLTAKWYAVKTGGHISVDHLQLFSTSRLFTSALVLTKIKVCPAAFVKKSVPAFCPGAFLISAISLLLIIIIILLLVIPRVLFFSDFRAPTVSPDDERQDSGTSVSSRELEACTENWNQVSCCWDTALPEVFKHHHRWISVWYLSSVKAFDAPAALIYKYLLFQTLCRGSTVRYRQVHAAQRNKDAQRCWPLLGTPEPFGVRGAGLAFCGKR